MTKQEIIYVFDKYGIKVPLSGTTDFLDLSDKIFYLTFADATKNRKTDSKILFKFDSGNEVIIEKRIRSDGKDICYPGTETTCLNVYSYESLLNVVAINKEAPWQNHKLKLFLTI